MSQNDILVCSSLLTTNDKLPDRFLFSGKIEAGNCNKSFLFYLFEITTPWSSSCVKIKKNILDIIEKRYHPKNTGDSDVIFENILQEINESLNSLAHKGENSWIGNLNSIIGLVNNNEISIAQAGRFSGYIFRKGRISSLTENSHLKEQPHPLKTFSDVTSGRLVSDDRIVFGNMDLYNHFSLDRIRKTVEHLTANESLQELYKALKRNKIVSVNAIIIEVKPDTHTPEDKKTEELPEIIALDKQEESIATVMAKKYSPIVQKYYKKTKKTLLEAKKSFTDQAKTRKQNFDASGNIKSNKILSKSMSTINVGISKIKEIIAPQINKLSNNEKYNKVKIKTFPYAKKTVSSTTKFFTKFSFLGQAFKQLLLKNNRKYLYGSLILLLIFFGYLKIRANNSDQAHKKEVQQIALSYDKAKEAYNKAKEDIALGKSSDTKPIEEALVLSKKAEESPATKEKAVELSREIQTSLDKLTKTTRLFDPKPSITFNGSIKKIILAGLDIYGFDSDGKIYSANTGDNDPRLVASIGKENSDVLSATYSSTKNKIFIYTNNKLISYDIASKTQGEAKIVDEGGKWENAKAISSFVSNIYLLDSETGEVWKHAESDGGYGKGTAYANANKTNLKGAIDLAVDGNIYVLLSDGNIAKFAKGAIDQSFSTKGLPSGDKIETPARIYTDADTNYLFVLDKKLNRVIRFDKAGNFVNQYTIDNMPIDDFVVNGKVQKLWLLSGGKIFSIDL